jgi:hypothetical protein
VVVSRTGTAHQRIDPRQTSQATSGVAIFSATWHPVLALGRRSLDLLAVDLDVANDGWPQCFRAKAVVGRRRVFHRLPRWMPRSVNAREAHGTADFLYGLESARTIWFS